MDDYDAFLNRLQKRGSKPYRLGHCLGSRNAFEWVRKNKWKALDGVTCDRQLYSKIVNEVNKVLAEKLLEGHEIELPYQMGKIVLSSKPAKVMMVDGVLKSNYRIDWKKTCQWMFDDEEAFGQHKRVMRIEPFIYSIRYYKCRACFRNRQFYCFRPSRSLVRRLGKAIDAGKIQAETTE